MADQNDNNGNQELDLMDLPPDNHENANQPQLSPRIMDVNQPQLSAQITDSNHPQLSQAQIHINPGQGDNGNQPSLSPLQPLVEGDNTNSNDKGSHNGNKPLSPRLADRQLSESENRTQASLAERRFRRRSGNGNQQQQTIPSLGAEGGATSNPPPCPSERRSRKRSSGSFTQLEPLPPLSPRLRQLRTEDNLNTPPSHLPPQSPRLVDRGSSPLTPDTVENVASQTEGVFRNFAFQMYTNDTTLSQEMEATTPALPEITSFTDAPIGQAARVGRQLAQIGDDLDKRYSSEFTELVNLLNITPDTAYESFAGIARKVFYDGRITWSRVVTLLCFAYRMGINVLRRGIRGFFSRIVQYLCRFVVAEKIAQWIAEQGGWVAALRIVPETIGWPVFAVIVALAGAAVLASIFMGRR